jgi:hypothetical protein
MLAKLHLLLAFRRVIPMPPAVLQHRDAGLALQPFGERFRGALRHDGQRKRQIVARGKLQQAVQRRRRVLGVVVAPPEGDLLARRLRFIQERSKPAAFNVAAEVGTGHHAAWRREVEARSFRATISSPGSAENFSRT